MQLTDKLYVYTDNEQPYCVKCYSDKLNIRCQACDDVIQLDEERIEYDNYTWHVNEQCFRCSVCRKSLMDSDFNVQNGDVFCLKNCAQKQEQTLNWNV